MIIKHNNTDKVMEEEFWSTPFNVALPQIGCGLGNLDWDKQVYPIVRQELADVSENVVLVKSPPR
jgi:hypothetical protein